MVIGMDKAAGRGLMGGVVIGMIAAGIPAAAQDVARRVLGLNEAAEWRAVGSLRIAGHQSCTAVLISDQEALTAAHCVVDRATGTRIVPQSYVLILGQMDGRYAAVRRVTATAFLPGFITKRPQIGIEDMASDLALLELAVPVTQDEATPATVADWPDPTGADVDIVGYEWRGPLEVTMRQGCKTLDSQDGVTAVGCDVITGLSGSPVLLSQTPDGPLHLVASVSARGNGTAYVVTIAPHLAELRALLAQRNGAPAGAPGQSLVYQQE